MASNIPCRQCLDPTLKGMHDCGLIGVDTFSPSKPYDFSNPADQLRRLQDQPWIGSKLSEYSTSPIKVFTVCVDPEHGRYMAFLGSDPEKKATGGSRSTAIYQLLIDNKIITETEID